MTKRPWRLVIYLVQLCVAHWDGIRPLHEVWTATVDIDTARLVPDLGDRLMAALASGRLRTGAHDAGRISSRLCRWPLMHFSHD